MGIPPKSSRIVLLTLELLLRTLLFYLCRPLALHPFRIGRRRSSISSWIKYVGYELPVGERKSQVYRLIPQARLGYTIKRVEIATVQSLVSVGANII